MHGGLNDSCSLPQMAGRSCHPSGRGHGFTLIEMIVVVSIIVVIMGITLPALKSMWDERRLTDAETTLQGLLMTTRTRALSAQGVDSGLLFYVDSDGVQRIVPIRQAMPSDVVGQNVFAVMDESGPRLRSPVRVVPRYVFDAQDSSNTHLSFSEFELSNNDFLSPPQDSDAGQRHRNFFTLIFNGDGNLSPWRDVLVQDPDADETGSGRGLGDVTGLPVGADVGDPVVTQYSSQQGDTVSLDPLGSRGVSHLITDGDGVAINFPSVDGLLVYDDSLFNEAGGGNNPARDRRDYLLRAAQPLYINRWTGAVIRGPVGKGDAQ